MSYLRCGESKPHAPHDMPAQLNYPCSGTIECKGTKSAEPHEPHRLVKTITLTCVGVEK